MRRGAAKPTKDEMKENDEHNLLCWSAITILLGSVLLLGRSLLLLLYRRKGGIQQTPLLHTQNKASLVVPFVVYQQEPDWKILYSSLQGWRRQNHGLLMQLSGAIRTASSSRYQWLIDHHYYDLVDDLQEQLDRLAAALEQDATLLERHVLVPFDVTLTLPEDDHVASIDETTFAPTNTTTNFFGFTTPQKQNNSNSNSNNDTPDHSYHQAGQVMAHLVRDWTAEGRSIRASLYDWCRQQVLLHQQTQYASNNNNNLRILVPGAGLGRLAWELATTTIVAVNGRVSVQAVECSVSMAAAAAAIWQRRLRGTLHPYAADHLTNQVYDARQRLDAVSFPDVDNLALPDSSSSLSYTVSDFVRLKSLPGYRSSFDVVVTCFFVDTAVNVLDYVDTIRAVLVSQGGLWVNVGPLQWHRQTRLPISAAELQRIVVAAGFDVLEWSVDVTPLEYRNSEHTAGDRPFRKVRSTHYDAYCPLRFVLRLDKEKSSSDL